MAKNNTKIVKKNKPGQPPKITEDRLRLLRGFFLMGCPDDEACLGADISPETLYAYQRQHPEYSDQKRAWKKNPSLKARKTMFESLTDPDSAWKFLTTSKDTRDEFSTKVINESVNPDGDKKLDTLAGIITKLSKNVKREFKKPHKGAS